jgi:hypothetical protein
VLAVTAVAAVAANVPVDPPAAIVIDAGTFSCAFEDARATATPYAGAAWERVIVHAELPGATSDDGVQASAFTDAAGVEGPTVIDPPVAVLGIAVPVPDALTGWTIAIGIAVVEGVAASATDTTAIVPFAMGVVFIPDIKQIVEPDDG